MQNGSTKLVSQLFLKSFSPKYKLRRVTNLYLCKTLVSTLLSLSYHFNRFKAVGRGFFPAADCSNLTRPSGQRLALFAEKIFQRRRWRRRRRRRVAAAHFRRRRQNAEGNLILLRNFSKSDCKNTFKNWASRY